MDLLEVEIRQIHISVFEDVPSFLEAKCEKRRSQVPVVALTPRHGSAGSFVEAICNGPVASFPFTSTDMVPPRFDAYKKSAAYVPARDVDCDVDPFAGFRPTHVEQVCGRNN